VNYVVAGEYDETTSDLSGLLAPNVSFEFTFSLDDQPVPVAYDTGYFELAPVGLTYSLDGTPVGGIVMNYIRFFPGDPDGLGMLGINFSVGSDTGDFYLTGPQLYSGNTSAPTMLSSAIAFLADGGAITFYGEDEIYLGQGQMINAYVDATLVPDGPGDVPEPATVSLLLAAALPLALRLRARSK
jgi:hypothetical protein